jgi:glycosyltransferase involved in cell wall biosynthesis
VTAAPAAVSVVIPCYNYERYVGLCVQSVLAQTLPALEVIVVNDGSTDGSAAVLQRFGRRIKVIEQDNAGHVAALNRGFAESRGNVVMFVDADDLLHPDAVEQVAHAWTPQCAKVQFELELIDARGELLERRFCNYVEPYGAREVQQEFDAFGTYVWPVSSGNAYSRWFLQRLLPLRVHVGPDGVLNTLAPLHGEVQVVTRPLAYYRMHPANQSGIGRATAGDFAKIVELRLREFRLLEAHARMLGRELPPVSVMMNREIRIVSYRLMLKRLAVHYEGASGDTPAALWRAGMTVLRTRRLPARRKLLYAVWLSALLCTPRWMCRQLIVLQVNRAALLQCMRRGAESLLRRPAIR